MDLFDKLVAVYVDSMLPKSTEKDKQAVCLLVRAQYELELLQKTFTAYKRHKISGSIRRFRLRVRDEVICATEAPEIGMYIRLMDVYNDYIRRLKRWSYKMEE